MTPNSVPYPIICGTTAVTTFRSDEVFRPKDVNLENGDLDEFEKELEAFKRYVSQGMCE